jgi:Ca-activated chloride channel family protein
VSWLYPGWFWLLLPVGALLLFSRDRSDALQLQSGRGWLLPALLMIIVALARPVLTQEPIEIEQSGSDVVIAVDLSYSMQANDIEPNRLEAAKTLLSELVKEDTKNRFGVIGFTTNAIVLSPMTDDAQLLLHLFVGLDETLVTTKGTVMMPALKLSRKMSKAEQPIIVLLSDGGDEDDYVKEAAFAKKNGLLVNVVMLASRFGSTLEDGRGEMVKDEAGNIVVSARNDAIKALSRASGGEYIDGADLSALQEAIAGQSHSEYKTKKKIMQHTELFYYFVIAALFFFMLSVTTLGKRIRIGRWRKLQ